MSKPRAVDRIAPLAPPPTREAGHLALVEEEERVPPLRSRPRVGRALILAAAAVSLGVGLALTVQDSGFGWLGAGSTAAVLGSLLARRAGQPLVAATLGTAGFFGASILACAAALFAVLAAIPALLG